jgi:NAD(P)-dependent dehydrogenase (short-subunit alcohol dehydrogenase family)
MDIQGRVAVVTGAAGGIGRALSIELARRGARMVAMVDQTECVATAAQDVQRESGRPGVALPFHGDVTNLEFRRHVFDTLTAEHGPVHICVPAAGITRDALAVRIDKSSGVAQIYPEELFHQVLEINLVAPIYWVLEMVARIAAQRHEAGIGRWLPTEDDQGVGILIGSVSSLGNKGQISYATTKAGLEGAAATLMTEAMYHGVRCAIIHPGYTDTPMVRALGDEFIARNILPFTQLGRLVRPEEIADAICFMISNAAVSGPLWADAGWHPPT